MREAYTDPHATCQLVHNCSSKETGEGLAWLPDYDYCEFIEGIDSFDLCY